MKPSKLTLLTLAVITHIAGQAAAKSHGTKNFLSKQCDEDALFVRVDPGPLQEFVGRDFSVLVEEGTARVLIVVQDCVHYWLDGQDLGPTQHAHVWVALEGPRDVRPVVGAERTRPTATWFSLFAGSTNPRGREARNASGTSPAPIEGVFLDPPGAQRGGRVSVGPGLSYAWNVSSAPPDNVCQ